MEKSLAIKEEVEQLLYDAYKVSLEDITSAISITEKALFKSQKIKNKDAVHADGLNQLSILQRKNKEFLTSKTLAERALDLSDKIDYKRGSADANYNLAKIYIEQQRYNEALPHLSRALAYYQKTKENRFHAKVLTSIGNIYIHFQDYKNALSTLKKALSIVDHANLEKQRGNVFLHLANCELERGKTSPALKYALKAVGLIEKYDDKDLMAEGYYLLGKIHLKAGQFKDAKEDFSRSLNYFEKLNSAEGIVRTKEKLGEVLYLKGHLDQASVILLEAADTATENDFRVALYKCHYNLYKVHKANDTDQALFHLEEYGRLKELEDSDYLNNLINSYDTISKIEGIEKDAEVEQEKASIIHEKNTELDSFFYRVSHDLKGPIASLMGLSDLAKRDIEDAVAKGYLKMYDDQIKRLNMIVMELINITELNYKQIKTTKIDFYEIIDNCIASYTYLQNFSRISFSVNIQSNIKYQSEWYIINTILQNLIENAIKYSDKEKDKCSVRIMVESVKNQIRIIVSDNGLGIGQEHQEKIFNMFYRANDTQTGTGLGLFILKRAVERLKGQIDLDSTVGEGSTFRVSLPHH